jgi:hypothetical protein
MKRIRHLWFAALLGLPAALFALNGCDDSKGSVVGADAESAIAGDAGFGQGGPMAGLTLGDIESKIDLSSEQKTAIGGALDRLNAARKETWGRRGERDADRAKQDPPVIVFLESASKTLDPDQFRQLAILMKEKRDANRGEMAGRRATRGPDARAERPRGRGAMGRRHGGMGMGPGSGMMGNLGPRLGKELDLSAEQRQEIRPILQQMSEKMRSVQDQVASGAITREQARERIGEIRTETMDKGKKILTAEQWEKFQKIRGERVGEMAGHRLDRLEPDLERRAEFLNRVLGLSDTQREEVRTLVLGTAPARTEILNGLKSGAIEPEDAAGRIATIEETLAGQISSLLSPDQLERWHAVRDLLPGHAR